ncbi:ribosome silencing factor, partial [Corallococcus exiguus]|nr:ribosome silencing factor [Corallococcus exiguus]
MATKKKTPASKKAKAKSTTRAPARKKTAAKKAKPGVRPPPRKKTAAARKKAPKPAP